ncbi:MAG: alpha/beta hydrolase [Actinomycetota bacterium]|nr:alpha/beta hydrolase [Actinomycetota bacterium]
MVFLIVHGLEGSGPEHWQSWLAERLRARGLDVAYPSLPESASPRLERWLDALDAELAALPAAETTVLCHSLGSLLWLHHAARRPSQQVARSLLVAPPQPDDEDAPSIGFRPTPLDRVGVAAAAYETRLVCSTNDPWCPPETSRRMGEATGVTIDWLEHAGHVNTDAGFGPWPAVEAWALGEQAGLDPTRR